MNEKVEMIALTSWTGAEGKVRRGGRIFVSERRARELENPKFPRTTTGLDGRKRVHQEAGKPKARRVFDAPAPSPENDPDEPAVSNEHLAFFRARLAEHSVPELHEIRANLATAIEDKPTAEQAAQVREVDAELFARGGNEEGGSETESKDGTGTDDGTGEVEGAADNGGGETKGGGTAKERSGFSWPGRNKKKQSKKKSASARGPGNPPASE